MNNIDLNLTRQRMTTGYSLFLFLKLKFQIKRTIFAVKLNRHQIE